MKHKSTKRRPSVDASPCFEAMTYSTPQDAIRDLCAAKARLDATKRVILAELRERNHRLITATAKLRVLAAGTKSKPIKLPESIARLITNPSRGLTPN